MFPPPLKMFDLAFLTKMNLHHDNKISYISEVCFKMKKSNNKKEKKKKRQQPNTRNVIWEDVKLVAGRSAGAGTRRLPANK